MGLGTRRATARDGATTGSDRESGQALVELALVTPLLVLLIAAIFQFAFILQTQIGLTNAVREAARRAAAADGPTEAWIRTQLCGDPVTCTSGLLPDNVQGFDEGRLQGGTPVSTFCTYSVNGDAQYRVDVSVTYDHPEFFPIAQLAALAAGQPSGGAWNWTLSAAAQMRLEFDLASAPGSC